MPRSTTRYPNADSLIDAARSFRRHHLGNERAAQWENDRQVPLEVLRLAAGHGFTGIEVPVAHGGLDLGYRAKLRLVEELSSTCMAFAFSLVNTHNVAAKIARHGSSTQAEKYLPELLTGERIGATALTELGAGSDLSAIATSAQRVDDGWLLNGGKAWITNATVADLFLVYAQTEPNSGARGIGCFIVDARRRGFDRHSAYSLLGGHTMGVSGFGLHDYHVDDSDLLYPPDSAFKSALNSINGARTYVAAMCCGMLYTGLELALEYGSQRRTFGQLLSSRQGLNWLLADVATDYEAARALTERATVAIEAGKDAVLAAAHAKKFATRIAVTRLADCIQTMGANGLRDDIPLGRHLACAKITHFVDGTTEIQNERIAAALHDTYPATLNSRSPDHFA